MSSLPVGWHPPTGWKLTPFGEVATLQRGFDLPIQERQDGNIKIFAANGPVGTHSVYQVRGPGVVTGRSGSIGKVHYVDEDFWPLNTALWVKDFHGNDPKWVARMIAWLGLEQFIRGVGVPTLNRNLVHEVIIPLPPLEEQKRIAAILDQADALRRLRARALDRLNALGQAIFHEMFGDFSDGKSIWPLVRLGDLIESGKIGLVRGANEQGEDRPVKYLRMDAISQDGSLDLSALRRVDASVRERQEFSVLPGDLLFNTRNSRELVGKTAVVRRPFDGVFNNNILRLRFSGALNSSFLDAYLRTRAGSSALDTIKSGTTSVFAIYQKTLLELQVPTPPPALQLEFAERLDTLLDRIELSDVAMKKAGTLFTSLQHRAFRGAL